MFYHITSLRCKIEENNKFDSSAAAIIHDDCLNQEVLNVPLHVSKTFYRSLKLTTIAHQRWLLLKEWIMVLAMGLRFLLKKVLADKPVCWGETRIKKLKKLQIIWWIDLWSKIVFISFIQNSFPCEKKKSEFCLVLILFPWK